MNMDEVNKFIAPEAEAEFLKLLSKPVGKERGFLPTREDGDLLAMIREKGSETFCECRRFNWSARSSI